MENQCFLYKMVVSNAGVDPICRGNSQGIKNTHSSIQIQAPPAGPLACADGRIGIQAESHLPLHCFAAP